MDLSNLSDKEKIRQCSMPTGEVGMKIGEAMNEHHKPLFDWAFEILKVMHDKMKPEYLLDIGCGAGLVINMLCNTYKESKVYGIDYSVDMVKASKEFNKAFVDKGQVEVKLGSVSELPFEDNTFDIITATETWYFWPDIPKSLAEIKRVLKKDGIFIVINEAYDSPEFKNDNSEFAKLARLGKINLFSVDRHKDILEEAGFNNIHIHLHDNGKWIFSECSKKSKIVI